MPSAQRGTLASAATVGRLVGVTKRGNPRRRTFGAGREGKAEAKAFLERTLREVEALRRGDPIAQRRQDLPRSASWSTNTSRQHPGEANTRRTLRARLRYATEGPKLRRPGGWRDLRIDRLTAADDRRMAAEAAGAVGLGDHEGTAAGARLRGAGEAARREPRGHVPNPEPKRREVSAFESWTSSRRSATSCPTSGRCRCSSG